MPLTSSPYRIWGKITEHVNYNHLWWYLDGLTFYFWLSSVVLCFLRRLEIHCCTSCLPSFVEAVSPIFGLRLWFGGRDYLLLERRESILFWPCCKQLLLQHFPVMIFQPSWELKQKDSDPAFLTLDMKSVTHSFATFLGIQGVFHYVTFLSPRIVKDTSALLHVNKCFSCSRNVQYLS